MHVSVTFKAPASKWAGLKEVLTMSVALLRPTRLLSPFRWDSDDWFDDFLNVDDVTSRFHREAGYSPSMESYVKDNEMHLRAEIPGVDPKDVDVSLKDGHLCVTGERKRANSADDACYCFGEMSYGKFTRCFSVPRDAESEKIHAKYEHGMLDITVPLGASAGERRIPIEGAKERKRKLKGA